MLDYSMQPNFFVLYNLQTTCVGDSRAVRGWDSMRARHGMWWAAVSSHYGLAHIRPRAPHPLPTCREVLCIFENSSEEFLGHVLSGSDVLFQCSFDRPVPYINTYSNNAFMRQQLNNHHYTIRHARNGMRRRVRELPDSFAVVFAIHVRSDRVLTRVLGFRNRAQEGTRRRSRRSHHDFPWHRTD